MRKTPDLHKARFKAIRRFVSFKVDLRKNLSKNEKRKISKYFNALDPLTARSFHVFRSKDNSKLKRVREFSGNADELNSLKELKNIALVPVADPKLKKRIKVTAKSISIEYDNVKTQIFEFDKKALIKDPDSHIENLISENAPNAKQFNVAVGQDGIYEIADSIHVGNKERIKSVVKNLMERYSPGGKDYYKKGRTDNHFKNWLFGLKAHEFLKQEDWKSFRREWFNTKAAKKKDRKNELRRRKYRKGF